MVKVETAGSTLTEPTQSKGREQVHLSLAPAELLANEFHDNRLVQ